MCTETGKVNERGKGKEERDTESEVVVGFKGLQGADAAMNCNVKMPPDPRGHGRFGTPQRLINPFSRGALKPAT